MDGSAEKVELRKDKICLCSECAADIDIVNTEEVFILDEDRLEFTLHNFKQVEASGISGRQWIPTAESSATKEAAKIGVQVKTAGRQAPKHTMALKGAT